MNVEDYVVFRPSFFDSELIIGRLFLYTDQFMELIEPMVFSMSNGNSESALQLVTYSVIPFLDHGKPVRFQLSTVTCEGIPSEKLVEFYELYLKQTKELSSQEDEFLSTVMKRKAESETAKTVTPKKIIH